MMKFEIENKASDWSSAYEKVLVCADNALYITIIMASSESAESVENLLELAKVFPLIDILTKKGKKVTINIKRCKSDIRSRILPLIFTQMLRLEENTNVAVQYDGCPVHCVAGPYCAGDPFFSEKNTQGQYTKKARTLLKTAKVIRESSTGDVEKRILLVDELLNASMQDFLRREINKVNRKYRYDITFKYKQEHLSNIFPLISISMPNPNDEGEKNIDVPMDMVALNIIPTYSKSTNDQFSHLIYLEQCFETYITNPDIFAGYEENQIDAKQKKRLLQELAKQYDDKKMSMSFLGRLVWINLLRNLIESKDLFTFSEMMDGKKECTLDIEAIEKSSLTCATYAEGLYQIIENSCVYSHGQRAYFGMRMYRVSSTGSTEKNLYGAKIKQCLYDKYKMCYKSSPDGRVSNVSIFTEKHSRLLEFYVLDDASNGEGILYKSKTTIKEDFEKLSELIKYQPILSNRGSTPISDYADKIAHHYGMRVFFKNIERNDGCIILETPHDPSSKAKQLLYSSQEKQYDSSTLGSKSYLTSYNILLPLFPQDTNTSHPASTGGKAANVFPPLVKESFTVCRFRCDKLYYTDCSSKEEKVDSIECALSEAVEKGKDNTLLAVDARFSTVYDAELLAKAIFKLTAEYCTAHKLKIAVLFLQNSNCPQEFIRIFSSFYDKLCLDDKETKNFVQEKETEDFVNIILGNLQIAVCTSPEGKASSADSVASESSTGSADDADAPDALDDSVSVNFVLLGKSPDSVYVSAHNYLYVNFDECVQYIPLLKYLSLFPSVKQKPEEEDVFPFDVYLSKACFGSGEPITVSPEKDCLFLDRMNSMLRSELQLHSDGCLIPNIHMRLGSKIHLDRFYEAELLFRSVGNIQRFAYIIAGHILTHLSEEKQHIMLVGYEKYSAELILQINQWLKRKELSTGAYLIPAVGEERRQCIELMPFSKEIKQNEERESTETKTKPLLITVIPVGSTMSTIYKVKHAAINEYHKLFPKAEINDFLDYCIVAINSQITGDRIDNDITWRYWKSVDPQGKKIVVLPDKNEGSELVVNYLLSAEAQWLSPLMVADKVDYGCEMCRKLSTLPKLGEDRFPLLQVDKTSMVPTSIFKLKNSKMNMLLPGNIEKNRDRIESLKGYIEYGHICQGDNHYQFYIDHQKFYQDNCGDIDAWLKKIKVDQSAFNIVISPNDTDNSVFVNSALENIFGNSLRYLHIDINNAYREDIRLKFSKIADEYRYLRLNMPNVKFNIYYVSNTIVSARTIARAKLLVCTLLDESGIAWPYPYIFEKVILLICRSSYSTMKQYVQFPNSQVEAYIQLSIPQYNTSADKCPACKLQEEYALLRKRSTTAGLSQRFERLEKKNQKRTLPEFGEWQAEDILTNHSYYCRLKNWLYFHKNPEGITKEDNAALLAAFEKEFKGILCHVTGETNESEALKILRSDSERGKLIRESLKEEIYKRNLRDIVRMSANDSSAIASEQQLVDIVRKTVVSDHNYMRLYCLQHAYEELIPLNADECTKAMDMNKSLDRITRKKILEIISRELENEPNNKYMFAENAEWLISFIKVLSREHLARYYHIKKAMVNIMYDMLAVISAEENIEKIFEELKKEDDNWAPIIYTLRFFEGENRTKRNADNSLCASLQYELFMTLVHRLAVMQCSVVYQQDAIKGTIKGFSSLNKKYFNLGDYKLSDGADDLLIFTELPPMQEIINRYIKSIKTATMLTANDDPCYQLLEGEFEDA